MMKAFAFLSFSLLPIQAGEPDFFENEDLEPAAGWDPGSLFSGLQRVDLEHDLLHSGDIDVQRTSLSYRQERDGWSLEANLGFTDLAIDYSDPVGATNPSFIGEEAWSGGLTLGKNFSDSLSTTIGFSTYEGFIDFQSAWISEYYDQFIGIPFPDTYESASPKGWAVSPGLVWDYAPGTGRVTANFSYSRDDIVPAWSAIPNPNNSFIPEAEATIDSLETYQVAASWEAAVNAHLKSQVTFRYTDTTARDPRYQLRSQWSWAITKKLTARAHIGGAIERPEFEALYGGLSLNYEITPNWSVSTTARAYRDTGEISSAGFNTAAPDLRSTELSASLAWTNGDTSARVGVGIYDTDYDETDEDNRFFSDLYQDREFVVGRFALTHSF